MGVCQCILGACGIDCRESCPATGHSSRPPQPQPPRHQPVHQARGLAVYVYDLPADLGLVSFAHRIWNRSLRNGEVIYAAEWRFLDALLRDGSVRTLDPELADLFYVPQLGALGPGGSIGAISSRLAA